VSGTFNVVVPMAGRGSRFAERGIETPKPLIDVRGKPMYACAVDGLPLDRVARLVFICLREHLEQRALADDIARRYGRFDPAVLALDAVTEGQACTVLAARELIDNGRPLVIYNADTYCPTTLGDALDRMGPVDGVLDVFRAAGDKWSFARADDQGRVLETAEKRRISQWASTGLYYFGRGQEFVRHAEAMIAADERSNREFYVAPVYNRMIAAGMDVRINPVEEVWSLGTLEDLERFLGEHPL
jgi:dTDP-glucose pyrophosphorylase